MNDSQPGADTYVLLATDEPEHCAQAVLHLMGSQMPPGAVLLILPHGPDAEPLAAIAAQAVKVNPHQRVSMAPVPGASRVAALNAALASLPEGASKVAIVGQDVRVAPGWLQGLEQCLHPGVVHGLGERTLEGVANVGLVGACCDQTANEAQRLDLGEAETAMGLGAYAAARLEHFAGAVSVADTLEDFCVLLTAEVLEACRQEDGSVLDAACGTWAWTDLCLRAAVRGHRAVVSESVYVGRAASVPLGAQVVGDVRHRLRFYARHEVPSRFPLAAVVVVPFRYWHDLQLLRACLGRLAPLVDRVAIVVTSNPLDMQGDPEFPRSDKGLAAHDRKLLRGCNGADADAVGKEVGGWAMHVMTGHKTRNPGLNLQVAAEVYADGADPVTPRNLGIAMARRMGAEAVLMLNHDEMVEPSVNADTLQRILSHPNPQVMAFDVGLVYHHDAPTLTRIDAPWGHGGTYQGGPHLARLYRFRGDSAPILPGANPGVVPAHGISAYRVAGLRLRRLGAMRLMDRARLGLEGTGEGLRVSQWQDDNRIGLHVLLWRGEDAEDVARWLDDVHALVDHVVLVWTDEWAEADQLWTLEPERGLRAEAWPATGPSRALAAVAQLHGAEWVHEPLDDNIAQARNAGINALHEHGGLSWAMFIDPDEWLPAPLRDGVALRNMAESTRWGWLFQVANYRADGSTPTVSDSVRISRLDPEGRMRMNGRVHEGFSHAIKGLQSAGIHPRLVYAPFVLQHRGLAKDAEALDGKLEKYDRLLRLQLADEPHDPGSWVSLGWHYFNDGYAEQGEECYRRALQCAGTSYLPFKEMGYHRLRQAQQLFEHCDARLEDSHQFHALLQEMRRWLQKYAPPAPVVPRLEEREALPLPEWQPPGQPDPAAG